MFKMISSQEHKATYLHRISINYHHTALLAATTEYTSLTDTLNVINHISVKNFSNTQIVKWQIEHSGHGYLTLNLYSSM